MSSDKKVYYSVPCGIKCGIYNTWDECKVNIEGFDNPIYKKFDDEMKAIEFFDEFHNVLYVYTDGSCINNGKEDAIAGIGIYFNKNNENNVSAKLEGENLTNNIAELTAIIKAIQIIKKLEIEKKVIVSDSEYAIKCATTYGEKLAKKNWLCKNGNSPPNVDLVKKLYELTNQYNIRYKHVEAHTDRTDRHSIGNYNADKLANACLGIGMKKENSSFKSKESSDKEKIPLNVPYADKDDAKAKGARWDPNIKKWYIYADNKNKEYLEKKYDIKNKLNK